MMIEEGPLGTLGNKCRPDPNNACDPGLVCSSEAQYCLPSQSNVPSVVTQAVPPPDSANVPSATPIVLFFNGAFAATKFTVTIHQTNGTTDVTNSVTVTRLVTANATDIFVLGPKSPFPLGSTVVVGITPSSAGEDGGAPMQPGSLSFAIAHASPASADTELGFEGASVPVVTKPRFFQLPGGWSAFGDVAVSGPPQTAAGMPDSTLIPSEGSKLAVITTGEFVGGAAIGGTSSMLVSGPINGATKTVTFDYNFQSFEFDEYCEQQYDDTFLAVLAGPNGTVAKIVDSVALVCKTTHTAGKFPYSGGDDDTYLETGKKSFSLDASAVGSPFVAAFVVTDVKDAGYTTVVGVDNVKRQ
jgi:hypothetical protein